MLPPIALPITFIIITIVIIGSITLKIEVTSKSVSAWAGSVDDCKGTVVEKGTYLQLQSKIIPYSSG
ncbi:hypothetical protein ACFLVN_01655 [Chloroflexota bacterium]